MSDDHAQGAGNEAGNSGTSGGDSENAGGSGGIKFGSGQAGSTGGQGGGASNADFLASLSDDNRAVAQQRGWNSFDDVVNSYRNVEKAFSGRDTSQNSNQGGQEYRAGDYVFNKPENADEVGYNAEFAEQFRTWAVDLGIPPKQAAGLHDKFLGFAARNLDAQVDQYNASMAETMATVERDLIKEWGDPKTGTFQRNVQLAERAANKLGIMDELTELGVLVKNGNDTNVANSKIFSALAKIGNSMYAEDELHGHANYGANPFAEGDERAVSNLVRNDPATALMLLEQLPPEQRERWTYTRAKLKAVVKN